MKLVSPIAKAPSKSDLDIYAKAQQILNSAKVPTEKRRIAFRGNIYDENGNIIDEC